MEQDNDFICKAISIILNFQRSLSTFLLSTADAYYKGIFLSGSREKEGSESRLLTTYYGLQIYGVDDILEQALFIKPEV